MGSDPFEIARQAQTLAAQRRARRLRAKSRPARTGSREGSPRQRQGHAAETRASRYLAAQGLQILARNLRCKAGEIDLAARDAHILVFVEVRERHHPRFGGAAASVNRDKQEKLLRAARYFLPRISQACFDGRIPACRFDVICIDNGRLDWLKNAFSA